MAKEAEHLVEGFKGAAENAKDLVAAARDNLTDKTRVAERQIRRTIRSAKHACQDLQDKAAVGAREVDRAIRHHPYHTLTIGIAVGLLAGWLLGRSRD